MRLAILLMSIFLAFPAAADTARRLAWFDDARLGIFIHWGIYAVDGVSESWSFHNGHVSHEDYMAQLDGFGAERYDPAAWADLIARSGAGYAVLTAKHHDGVALWDTDAGDLDVVGRTPAGRDLIAPYVDALRERDLKVGLYYSLIDWTHHDYPGFLRDAPRYVDDPERWARFSAFNHAQIRELSHRFRPDLMWFDGDWEHSAEEWNAPAIRALLLADNPDVVINSRLQGHGDYATPEQGLPVTQPDAPHWELCMTMNDSWGWQPGDTNYKSANQIIRILVDCASLGGNLLLDIGPVADGTIPPEQVERLEHLGRWMERHGEAVRGTQAGIPPGHHVGPTTLSDDRTTLYLFLPYAPTGPVAVKGLVSGIERIRVVGTGTELDWDVKMKLSWRSEPGIVYVDVPVEDLDGDVTVLALELDGPVELLR